MKILMLCHRLPAPPTKGEKIRASHHLRALAARHEVSLVAFADEPGWQVHADALRSLVHRVEVVPITPGWAKARSVAAVLVGQPMTLGYFGHSLMRRRIRSLVDHDRHDVAFVYSSAMGQYVDELGGMPCVVDFVDMDSHKWLQYARRRPLPLSLLFTLEGRRMATHERRLGRLAGARIFVSDTEAALFRALVPDAEVAVLPLVIDTGSYEPVRAANTGAPPTIVFVGVMDYFPNVDAVTHFTADIFPRIRAAEPQARFLIVGQRPNRAVQRLASQPGVELVGAVPDVRPLLAGAHVSVAPFRVAQGMQTKILEAMAMGLPVVTTSVACKGLTVEPGRHLFLENHPTDFAEAVVRLLQRPALREAMGEAARRYVESCHSTAGLAANLDRIMSETVHSAPADGGDDDRSQLGHRGAAPAAHGPENER